MQYVGDPPGKGGKIISTAEPVTANSHWAGAGKSWNVEHRIKIFEATS